MQRFRLAYSTSTIVLVTLLGMVAIMWFSQSGEHLNGQDKVPAPPVYKAEVGPIQPVTADGSPVRYTRNAPVAEKGTPEALVRVEKAVIPAGDAVSQLSLRLAYGNLTVQTFRPGASYVVEGEQIVIQSPGTAETKVSGTSTGILNIQQGSLVLEAQGIFRLREGGRVVLAVINSASGLSGGATGVNPTLRSSLFQEKKPEQIKIID